MPQVHKGQFVREDLLSIEEGMAVLYRCHGFNFQILATRRGVAIRGELPFMEAAGAESVLKMIWRAIKQHEKIALPIGFKQEPYDEPTIEAMQSTAFAQFMKKDDDVPPRPREFPGLVIPGNGGSNA